MSEQDQVLVVGGGVVGLSAAYELAKAGAAVTVIERDEVADSASTGNAGLISVGHAPLPKPGLTAQGVRWMFDPDAPLYIPRKLNPALWQWFWQFRKACSAKNFEHCMNVLGGVGKAAGETFRTIIETEGIECEYQPRGELTVYLTEAGLEHAREECELMNGLGYATRMLNGDELRTMEPAFRDEVRGALLHEERAFCHPGKFVRELAERACNHGARLREGEGVRHLAIEHGRCVGAVLESGEHVPADAVILAAGIWSGPLARTAGVRIPMQAGKGYHMMVSAPEPCPSIAGVMAERYVAVTPMEGGLRLAGTLEFSGINDRLVRRRLELLKIGAAKYLRGIDATKVKTEWCGLRPCTADGLPAIGWAPGVERLFIATGHAMLGFALGPVSGKAAAACVMDQAPPIELEALSPARFVKAAAVAS